MHDRPAACKADLKRHFFRWVDLGEFLLEGLRRNTPTRPHTSASEAQPHKHHATKASQHTVSNVLRTVAAVSCGSSPDSVSSFKVSTNAAPRLVERRAWFMPPPDAMPMIPVL